MLVGTKLYSASQDDDYLPGEHKMTLTIENVAETNSAHRFRCIAGNVVANLSSDDAFLDIEGNINDTLFTFNETVCRLSQDSFQLFKESIE